MATENLPPKLQLVDSSPEDLSDDDDDSIVTEVEEDPSLLLIDSTKAHVEDIPADEIKKKDSAVIHAREYQLEMFQESLKRNIIVAMETGTGKTQVAILRIQAELEKSGPDKLVWFLAPTVALGEQQTRVLGSQISAVQIKFLSGSDGVDTWTDIRTWDDYLRNVRIVVSTYQVLLDAISHAFVRIDRLSLIVFDEAHNCVGRHPGSKIMALYHNHKAVGRPVPSILGLTASPIMRSKIDALELIEKTLDAVCKSPTIHREELLSIVKQPAMHYASYSQSTYLPLTNTMKSLGDVYHSMDIYEDPYIIRLQQDNSERSRVKLLNAIEKNHTYVFEQMRSLWHKSTEIQTELGSWAADYFISVTVTQFLRSVKENDPWFREWQVEEKQFLAKALGKIKIPTLPPFDGGIAHTSISDKATTLVHQLLTSDDGAIGIVFVREVATVAILAHMLSIHPSIKDRFRIGTMIGTSSHTGRKRDIGSLKKTNGQQDLEAFRSGKLNLLIATSVLEEGIDIPACNMVICFDKPDNLKAFIQRRGRAREKDSKLIVMIDKPTSQLDEWRMLEAEMKKHYEDDMRQVQELIELENSELPSIEPLYIPETGAQLDFDQAKSHLEHFCRMISTRQHIDSRPYYIYKRTPSALSNFPQIAATVVLPMSLQPPELRRVKSSGLWYSEKNASKDAAFQAYVGIYKAGLLNDNLLPKPESPRDFESRVGEIEVRKRWNPWTRIARAWSNETEVYQRRLRLINHNDDVLCEFDASLPMFFPELPDMEVFWGEQKPWRVEIGEMKILSAQDLQVDQSPALIDLAFRHRQTNVNDTSRMILHIRSPTEDIPFQQLLGQNPFQENYPIDTMLVRADGSRPWLVRAVLPSRDPVLKIPKFLIDEPVDVPWLALEKWPSRRSRNFLRPADAAPSSRLYQRPARLCRLDGTHISNVSFGILIPSIIHAVEVYLIATELINTLLKDVGYSDVSRVITAICSRGAAEATNYERFEFLGDNILKMLATATVTANEPTFPEGYLDSRKTHIVSNSRLCRAAVETGLDQFIIKERVGKKWQPLYAEEVLKADADEQSKRMMSTKTLADVVEALIGAAYIDGGMDKALACVKIFIREVEWHTFDSACTTLFNLTPMSTELPGPLAPLEELIGYSFRNKNLLIEAATHSSFGYISSTGSCMERLEFLGDAVLDNVITSTIWAFEREMSQHEMHLLRTACVNADLLGFLSMEWNVSQEATDILDNETTIQKQTKIPFWKFMRHVSQEISLAQREAEERYLRERLPILHALQHGIVYPWAQLAHLRIPKFFSDFFESVLGAVWVDSGASTMGACARVVERAGILPFLRHILAHNVDILHPKNHVGLLAGKHGKKVEYQLEVCDTEDGSKELFCKVLLGEEEIVNIGGGLHPEEIQVKAAYAAWRKLLEKERQKEMESTAEDEVMTL